MPVEKGPAREKDTERDYYSALKPGDRSVDLGEGASPKLVHLVALFLQNRAREIGFGQFRTYDLYEPHAHPDASPRGPDYIAPSRYYDVTAPLDSISYHRYKWDSSDQQSWDELSSVKRVDAIDGYRNPPPALSRLITIKVMSPEKNAMQSDKSMLVLSDDVQTVATLVVDTETSEPILCAWNEDLRENLPRVEDLEDRIQKRVTTDGSRRDIYTPEEQKFFNECLYQTWDELANRIYEMTEESDRPRVSGEDHRLAFRFVKRPPVLYHTTQFHALYQQLISGVSDVGDGGVGGDDVDDDEGREDIVRTHVVSGEESEEASEVDDDDDDDTDDMVVSRAFPRQASRHVGAYTLPAPEGEHDLEEDSGSVFSENE
ncbi:hypothetical protein OPT61_g7319 [Boeremia exigua]|uniref:Uncharacterized protein n=1 Tax=Boeremia exigua TaxID=749465 RepID=A0ACC2I2Y8_9PLEO|nr:hypothetical protein OPT61_g7319 [Boeremia exigua]